jgi:hypothetical protein
MKSSELSQKWVSQRQSKPSKLLTGLFLHGAVCQLEYVHIRSYVAQLSYDVVQKRHDLLFNLHALMKQNTDDLAKLLVGNQSTGISNLHDV